MSGLHGGTREESGLTEAAPLSAYRRNQAASCCRSEIRPAPVEGLMFEVLENPLD